MTTHEIISKFKGHIVTKILDYNDKYFVVEAMDRAKDSALYTVNKNSGLVGGFAPMSDFNTFSDALKNRVIFER